MEELAKALVGRNDGNVAKVFSDSHNISVAIKEYETSISDRGKQYAEKTAEGLKSHFSAHGGTERAAKLTKHLGIRKAAALAN